MRIQRKLAVNVPGIQVGLPLVIVLANPLQADVMLDDHHVLAAMWGNPAFVIPIDTTTGAQAEGRESFLRLEDYGVFASPVIQDGEIEGWETGTRTSRR